MGCFLATEEIFLRVAVFDGGEGALYNYVRASLVVLRRVHAQRREVTGICDRVHGRFSLCQAIILYRFLMLASCGSFLRAT